jgi:hypothetical protein
MTDTTPAQTLLHNALVKVRMHTAYLPDAPRELLVGLLASIERIADAALAAAPRSDAPADLVPAPKARRCIVGVYCRRHGFIHGAEAEELRERLEAEAAADSALVRRILDEVDARDSLAYLEAIGDQPPAASGPPSDGSVFVRVDRVYVEQMRGDGLAGPFSRVRLVEGEGEPRLELTTQPTPTPDTAEWWREVAQGLGVEIHKLQQQLASGPPAPPETVEKEWGDDEDGGWCPKCGNCYDEGHAEDCQYRAAPPVTTVANRTDLSTPDTPPGTLPVVAPEPPDDREAIVAYILSCRERGDMEHVVQVFDVLADDIRKGKHLAPQVAPTTETAIDFWQVACAHCGLPRIQHPVVRAERGKNPEVLCFEFAEAPAPPPDAETEG